MKKSPTPSGLLKEFLTLSLTKCLHGVNARSGSIFLLDDERSQLVLEVAQNTRGVHLEGLTQRIGEGVAGKVALRREPLLVQNTNTLPFLRDQRRRQRYQTHSFLSVPLEYSGDLIGVVNITERASGESFNN
ncbi:MAG: GAF domain-containing protein, partial [Candidatus Omnitrophota bacterium]